MSKTSSKQKIVLATGNAGKVAEFQQLAQKFGLDEQIEFVAVTDFPGWVEPTEDATTFVGNALIKAQAAAKHTGLPALADDSGLTVDALYPYPGLYSARYAQINGYSHADNPKLVPANLPKDKLNYLCLLDKLKDKKTPEQRRANFLCVLVFMTSADDPAPFIAHGRCYGHILNEPTPEPHHGHGYDPVFFCKSLQKSFAEVATETKNTASHRTLAFESLVQKTNGLLPVLQQESPGPLQEVFRLITKLSTYVKHHIDSQTQSLLHRNDAKAEVKAEAEEVAPAAEPAGEAEPAQAETK